MNQLPLKARLVVTDGVDCTLKRKRPDDRYVDSIALPGQPEERLKLETSTRYHHDFERGDPGSLNIDVYRSMDRPDEFWAKNEILESDGTVSYDTSNVMYRVALVPVVRYEYQAVLKAYRMED